MPTLSEHFNLVSPWTVILHALKQTSFGAGNFGGKKYSAQNALPSKWPRTMILMNFGASSATKWHIGAMKRLESVISSEGFHFWHGDQGVSEAMFQTHCQMVFSNTKSS